MVYMLERESSIEKELLEHQILTKYPSYQSEIAQLEWGPEDCWRRDFWKWSRNLVKAVQSNYSIMS